MENGRDLLIEEGTWQVIDDPKTAELFARSLFVLKESIDSGPGGVKAASGALLAHIESVYLQTDAHRAALKLYLLSLTGHLKPQDEPLQLINEAIKRGMAQIGLAKQGRATKKRRR